MPLSRTRVGDRLELAATALVAGGDALARDAHGRVVFVRGALPGEVVLAEVFEAKADFARARVSTVIEPSPHRVTPACPHVAEGCGGCDLQHVTSQALPGLKGDVVIDALRRLGRIDEPTVVVGPALPATGFRTTVRLAVTEQGSGFRQAYTHDVVPVESCLVAHPAIDELIAEGDFGSAEEVTLRVGTATGERLVVAGPTAEGVHLPDDVLVVGVDELRRGRRGWYHEVVAGRTWRISAESFFQSRTDGAGALVEAVRIAAGTHLDGPGFAIDAFCGVGLFAGVFSSGPDSVSPDGQRRFLAVERGASSAADARHNLAHDPVRVLRVPVERLRPSPADLVIADPARSGLGRATVATLTACDPDRFVLVSCDPAALGRDARLLATSGYELVDSQLVDLFPGTHHVEVVSRFDRVGRPR